MIRPRTTVEKKISKIYSEITFSLYEKTRHESKNFDSSKVMRLKTVTKHFKKIKV